MKINFPTSICNNIRGPNLEIVVYFGFFIFLYIFQQ